MKKKQAHTTLGLCQNQVASLSIGKSKSVPPSSTHSTLTNILSTISTKFSSSLLIMVDAEDRELIKTSRILNNNPNFNCKFELFGEHLWSSSQWAFSCILCSFLTLDYLVSEKWKLFTASNGRAFDILQKDELCTKVIFFNFEQTDVHSVMLFCVHTRAAHC